MQIGPKTTDLEAFEVLSVILDHPVHSFSMYECQVKSHNMAGMDHIFAEITFLGTFVELIVCKRKVLSNFCFVVR